ncbi:hypothetical protein YC2023_095638 [Brassica napus]
MECKIHEAKEREFPIHIKCLKHKLDVSGFFQGSEASFVVNKSEHSPYRSHSCYKRRP